MGEQCLFPYQSFPSQVTGGRLFLSVKVGMLNLSFRDCWKTFSRKQRKHTQQTEKCNVSLSQIPYDYTIEVTNRFKGLDLVDRGLDLVDRVPEELWTEVCHILQDIMTKTIPKKKKCKKAKWLSEEALQIAV